MNKITENPLNNFSEVKFNLQTPTKKIIIPTNNNPIKKIVIFIRKYLTKNIFTNFGGSAYGKAK